MKILYILSTFPVLSQTFILNEITCLIDLGHEVKIVSLYKPKDKKVHEKVKKYNLLKKTYYLIDKKYSRLEIFEKGSKELLENKLLSKEEKFKLLDLCYDKKHGREIAFRRFLGCLDVIRIIKEKKIKHIHCHFAKENVKMAYVLNQIIKIPYTFTTHAYDIFIESNKDIKKWADGAKKVITISNYNKKYMNENFGVDEDKIEVIHCGIELDKFRSVDYNKSNKLNILSIARLVEKKGIRYLIEACKILKEKGICFNCNILGDGKLKKEFQKLVNLYNLNRNVNFKGCVTQEEVLREFKKCVVFSLPCVEAKNGDKDGIPVSLMEAMAMEIPTISTDITGIPELIEDGANGIVVPQKDSKALAEAIIKIKDDKDFAENIRKQGRKKVIAKFNIKKNIKKVMKIFKSGGK